MSEEIKDEDVIVKMSVCQKCEGWVTVSVKHMMDAKSKNSFAKEAMEYNLKIQEIPLLEYRKSTISMCECNSNQTTHA